MNVQPIDDTATAWRGIVETWNLAEALALRLTCQITTNRGRTCEHLAHWRIDVHGCEERLVCTQHLRHWERRVLAVLRAGGGSTICRVCTLRFVSLESVCNVLPL